MEKPILKVVTKRGIQVVLGLIWLLDGLLQLQPKMFTSAFANNVILPASQNQPLLIQGPIHFAAKVLLLNPTLFNLIFAIIQILIGLMLLYRKTAKIGIHISIYWGLIVWIFGEAMGGLLGANGLLLMGLPGAVIIYVFLAVSTLPNKYDPKDKQPAFWLPLVWLCVWVIGAIYQLLPGQNTTNAVSGMISQNASSAPSFIASIDRSVSDNLLHQGHFFIITLAVIELLIGLMILLPKSFRIAAVIVGSFISLAYWVIGQSMGSFNSGLMTDPNTGPLLVFLGISLLGCKQLNVKTVFKNSWKHFEKVVI